MKNARLKVVEWYWPSIISLEIVLCQVMASGMRCSRGARLCLSSAAMPAGSGVPSFGSTRASISGA